MSQEVERAASDDIPEASAESPTDAVSSWSLLGVRAGAGGILMGLANLVPGISGGTMLLASGIYPRFIKGIAEVTKLRFKKPSLFVLGVVVLSALVAILGLAGVVKGLVVDHRWIMYSLFIGLTLGGLPVVWQMLAPADGKAWAGAVLGGAGMAALGYAQMSGATGSAENSGFLFMFFAGLAGASAMILPGVSGGYLLLLMGVYVPILGGISAFKDGLRAGDLDAMMDPMMGVVLPVGLGVVLGVLVVSNLLERLLRTHEKPTLGVLLGLLVGAPAGLWPFQEGIAPQVGDVFKGRVMSAELIADLAPDKYPTEFFTPSVAQVAGAIAMVLLGFALTALIARFGKNGDAKKTPA